MSSMMTPTRTPFTHAHENWFRGALRGRTRIAMAWVFVAVLIFSARQFPTFPGIAVCFLGATIRFWASGYLRKDSRPAVGGPYAFVRNPLYLGTYLMAVGTSLAIENWVLLAVTTVLFAVVYHYVILDEETKLRKIFGAPYLTYCELVPRFFPRIWPPLAPARRVKLMGVNPEPGHQYYSWSLSSKNKAFEAYVSFVGLIGFVVAVAFAWQQLQ
jgi:protein-S-isoprenylcysteine O-methyltransferase Ste14